MTTFSNDDKVLIVYGLLIGEAMRAREEGLFRDLTLGQTVSLLILSFEEEWK